MSKFKKELEAEETEEKIMNALYDTVEGVIKTAINKAL